MNISIKDIYPFGCHLSHKKYTLSYPEDPSAKPKKRLDMPDIFNHKLKETKNKQKPPQTTRLLLFKYITKKKKRTHS